MAGLDPAIQPTVPPRIRDAVLVFGSLDRFTPPEGGLDGRVKPGHDAVERTPILVRT